MLILYPKENPRSGIICTCFPLYGVIVIIVVEIDEAIPKPDGLVLKENMLLCVFIYLAKV